MLFLFSGVVKKMVTANLGEIFAEAAFQLSGGWMLGFFVLLILGAGIFFAQNRMGLPFILLFFVVMGYAFNLMGGIYQSFFYAILLPVGGVIAFAILYFTKQ